MNDALKLVPLTFQVKYNIVKLLAMSIGSPFFIAYSFLSQRLPPRQARQKSQEAVLKTSAWLLLNGSAAGDLRDDVRLLSVWAAWLSNTSLGINRPLADALVHALALKG